MKKNNSLTVNIDDLEEIEPITQNQSKAFDYWDDELNLILSGSAGTGKTFIALYLALESMLNDPDIYRKIIVLRSAVTTRDQGFLPGTKEEKESSYEAPYRLVCSELFGFEGAYNKMKTANKIQFETTSFLRGCTFDQAIVVIDEMQNLNFHELDSVITRLGDNCLLLFCGDFRQSDFKANDEKNGIKNFMKIIKNMKQFSFIEFTESDIVRSALVKSYIINKLELGIV